VINRRGFFSTTIGALILGPVTGIVSTETVLRYHIPTRTIRKVPVFPPEKILEIDFDGMVRPAAGAIKEFTRQLGITGQAFDKFRRDIMSSPVFTECEDVDEDPRHCIYCGQYPCDCWRDV